MSPGGEAAPYNLTSLGVTSQMRVGTRAWTSYQLVGGADGRTNAAVVGLNHQFSVGAAWRFQTMLERRQGVAGAAPGDPVLASPFERPEENYTAAALGAELMPAEAPYRASVRAEVKNGATVSSRLVTLAGDVSFDASLALVTRQEFLQRTQAFAGADRFTRQRSSLLGLAFRPTRSDRLNVLLKAEYKDGINPAGVGVLTQDGTESRMVAAVEAIWAPRAGLEVAGRVAERRTRAEGALLAGTRPQLRSQTRFVGSHVRYDAARWLAVKAEARGMFSNVAAQTVWDLAPALVLRPLQGLELEVGHRFGDLQDPDFAVKTGHGWYLTVGTRITESSLPTAAAFWRSRLGG